jgi:hypothetical protein|tara:strand:+ start:571 stop:987 length:417 start_codon:yes stop_codon:yes gene_type:complete
MMSFTMEQLWEQAKADHSSVYVTDLSSEAYVLHGIKFQRTEDTYVLLKGYLSDYYPEVPINYYDTLKDNGYRVGLCMLAMDRCEAQLDKAEQQMREEVNQKIVNDKRVKYLKAMRVTAMEKYSKFRQELNQYQLINHE